MKRTPMPSRSKPMKRVPLKVRRVTPRRSTREVDLPYLAYVRECRCLVRKPHSCGPSEPAHLKSRATWGSDHQVVPLCANMHRKAAGSLHVLSEKAFEKQWGLGSLRAIAAALYDTYAHGDF